MDLVLGCRFACGQEVAVTAFVRLRDVMGKPLSVPSAVARLRLGPGAATAGKFVSIDEEIELTALCVERDQIAISNQCEGAADPTPR